jgi:hypothetical protein
VELMAFAIVMLNGDLHNPENTEKMTKQQFVDNVKRSGATVVLSEQTLSDLYSRISCDPISFDNKLSPYPEAISKSYVDCKAKGVAGLRLWTRVWAIVCENYDATSLTNAEERNQRSGGYGVLFLCKSSRDESSVLLTCPLKRTLTLEEAGKREFAISQPQLPGTGPAPAGLSLRGVLGSAPEHAKVKFRCKTDADYHQWIRTLQYLLLGGHGYWYPWEQKDFDLDVPELGSGFPMKKTRRRRKGAGTMKKKKEGSVEGAAGGHAHAEPEAQSSEGGV